MPVSLDTMTSITLTSPEPAKNATLNASLVKLLQLSALPVIPKRTES